MLSPMAANSMAASTTAVTLGVVRMTEEKSATSVKEMFCVHMLRNLAGTRRFNHLPFDCAMLRSGLGASTPPR